MAENRVQYRAVNRLRDHLRDAGYVIIGPGLEELSDEALMFFVGLVCGTWLEIQSEQVNATLADSKETVREKRKKVK
jgi:hypothetical protein